MDGGRGQETARTRQPSHDWGIAEVAGCGLPEETTREPLSGLARRPVSDADVAHQPERQHRVFKLQAVLGDDVVTAVWQQGRLWADRHLLERAQLLTALDESFELPGNRPLPAGLGEPLQAALTLMRAADRVLQLEVSLDVVGVASGGAGTAQA